MILLKYLGSILKIFSVFFLLPILVALIYKESILPFIIPFFLSIIAGFLLSSNRTENIKISLETLTFTEGIILTAIAFLALSLISLIPFLFVFSGNISSIILNSFFEATSGITTTGLTVIEDLTIIPKSILFWRSETQWIGGIGIILMVLFIIYRLQQKEASEGKAEKDIQSSVMLYNVTLPEKLEPSLQKTAFSITKIYSVYTILGIILLFVVGLPFFDAITTTFTSISTGGFVVKNDFYTKPLQLIIIGFLMVIGATSFLRHNELFKKRFKEFFSNIELKLFLIFIIIGISISLLVFKDLRIIAFQLISASTTTGYSIADINMLPPLLIFLICLGMIVGGQIGSTAGGVKLYRSLIGIKSISWFIKKLASPKDAVIPFKINKKPMEESVILSTHILIASYLLFLIIGTAIFLVIGYSLLDSSFQVISALGTVGMQSMSLSAIHFLGKFVLICAMLLGRLEIFPFMVLFNKLLRKS